MKGYALELNPGVGINCARKFPQKLTTSYFKIYVDTNYHPILLYIQSFAEFYASTMQLRLSFFILSQNQYLLNDARLIAEDWLTYSTIGV